MEAVCRSRKCSTRMSPFMTLSLPGPRSDAVELRFGLPERYRRQAAEICYAAFRAKFAPIMRCETRAVAVLERDMRGEQAIVALWQEHLAGFAGLHEHGGRAFIDFKSETFQREFGRVRGLVKLLLFAPFVQRPAEGELLLETIAVDASARGRGIGSRLIEAVLAYASESGFCAVALEVVDTNPGAQRLYERMGFAPTRVERVPFLRPIMGFSAAIRMVKEIGHRDTF